MLQMLTPPTVGRRPSPKAALGAIHVSCLPEPVALLLQGGGARVLVCTLLSGGSPSGCPGMGQRRNETGYHGGGGALGQCGWNLGEVPGRDEAPLTQRQEPNLT